VGAASCSKRFLGAAVLALCVGLLGVGRAQAESGGLKQCAPISGPTWIFPQDTSPNSDLLNASISSNLYEAFTIGMPCSLATSYIKGIITQLLPITTPGVINRFTNHYFQCVAYPDRNGRAYGGSCINGGEKFDWNYNVIWHGVPGSSGGEGGNGVEPMGTIEYFTTLRPLGDQKYELDVQDASAIGTIDQFTWNAPPGLTITAVTGSSGANCSLASGAISCSGHLATPQCLCTGSGGIAKIQFTASGDAPTVVNGHDVIHGLSWSYLHITKMTPVPYLVPDVPQNVKKNV
jgi:hypothetical protein